VFTGIESAAGGRGGEGDRQIEGDDAAKYLISANEQITKILETATTQEDILRDGLRADLAQAGHGGPLDRIEIPNPDLTTIDSLADLGSSDEQGAPGGFAINSIVRLKMAAVAYLPATAHILHDAQAKLQSARAMFGAGVGNKHVVGSSSDAFFDLVDKLDTAMDRTRDFLCLSGEKLAAAADAYYQTEEQNDELHRLLMQELADFNYDCLTDTEYAQLHP
jgi:hypothetical protein